MLGAMLDTLALHDAVDRLADRLRRLPESRLRAGAAAAGFALAGEFAARAQRLETPAGPHHRLPAAGPFAAADQLAVTGHDLAGALAAYGTAEQLTEAETLIAAAARAL
jgi:hypothetical protein